MNKKQNILKQFYTSVGSKFTNSFLYQSQFNQFWLMRMQQNSLKKINVKITNAGKDQMDYFQGSNNNYLKYKVAFFLVILFTSWNLRKRILSLRQKVQKHNAEQKNNKSKILDKKSQKQQDDETETDIQKLQNKKLQGQKISENSPDTNKKNKIYFKDVLGINEYKEEIEDILDFLKNPNYYYRMGCNMTKGVLLTGPPGVGKTLLAKALANEANCHFIRVSGSDFDQIFVGSGQIKVQKIFKQARSQQPCIIFIDEFDSVGGKRVMDHEFYRGTLNQLLAEMDGFKKTDKIIVLAATNLPDSLDPAIKRSGRFDRLISIPYPSYKSRVQLLNYYLNKVKFEQQNINIETIANLTTGFTGADIKNLINQSAFETVRQGREKIKQEDIESAFDRVIMGSSKKSMLITEEQKLKTAYHEAGHALMSLYIKGNNKLHKVTILPRGQALGFTGFVPEKDNSNYNKRQLLGSLMSALGGRAAEELIYGNQSITTGCGSDLVKATQIAYQVMAMYGMGKEGYILNKDLTELSDLTRKEIDLEKLFKLQKHTKSNQKNWLKNLCKKKP